MFGHFCTGVTVITTVDADGPAGFACQAFAALSLDPPLVLFCPRQRLGHRGAASSEPAHFCVNVLAEDHRDVSRVFGARGADKFADVRLAPVPVRRADPRRGADLGRLCRVEAVHPGGDHAHRGRAG